MTLFLDTSALVKLYIAEEKTAMVMTALQSAKIVTVSTLAMPETVSSFTRKAAEGTLRQGDAQEAFKNLLNDWPNLERVDLDDWIAKEAAVLTRSKGLRGADAVHLATCARVSRERRGVRFLAFDDALNEAAKTVVKLWD
jgi:uncharacterized protein